MDLKGFFAGLSKQLLQHRYQEFSRKNLAATVAPFIPPYDYDETNAKITLGFTELKEWTRIAYDREKDKGTLYDDLMKALDHFIEQISDADENHDFIAFDKGYIEKFKNSACQIISAHVYLASSAKRQDQTQIISDKHGNQLAVPFIQPYNRPNDSHLMASYKTRQVGRALDKLLAGLPVETSHIHALKPDHN